MKVKCICKTCQAEFYVRLTRIRDGRGIFCSKHCQCRRHGRVPIHNDDGTVTIPLTRGVSTVIDARDFNLVRSHSWCAKDANGVTYAVARIKGKTVRIHHLIYRPTPGMVIDHIDGDSLNNRRSNLRICTQAQNLQNCRPNRGKTFKGVAPSRSSEGKFIARFQNKRLGTFETEEDAAAAYDQAAIKTYGEYARTNFPSERAS